MATFIVPMNNPITFITSTVAGLHFCCTDSYMCSSANFRIVFSESQNASPLDAELGPDFNRKWPFKVIRFGVNEEPLRGYIVQYNNCGLECEGSEDIASERSENRLIFNNSSHSNGSWQVTPKTASLSIVEPRGIWTCVSLQCTSTSGGSTL